MNSLADFIEYDGEVTSGAHPVLVWSLSTGYYFTQFNLVDDNLKIIARSKKGKM